MSCKPGFILSEVACLMLIFAGSTFGDQWSSKANMAVSRCFVSTAVVNGTLYAIGGGLDLNTSSPAVEAYDAATNTWTRRADLPQSYCGTVACAVGEKIYVIGGAFSVLGSVVATVYEYTPASNSWARKADIPTALAFAAAGVVNGKIYVIGGAASTLSAAYNTVYAYDPGTDTWVRKTDMPTARFAHAATVVNGKIYVFGGTAIIYLSPLSAVEVYDVATDTWSARAPMPTARYSHGTDIAGGKIYAVGGGVGFGTASSVVEEYDPASNGWRARAPMPTARWAVGVATVAGRIYAIGGASASNAVLPTVEEYTPDMVAPATPVLVGPADAAIGIPLTTTLNWTAVNGAATYHLQVSTRPDFSVIVVDDSTLTGISCQIGPLSNGTAYYWRVSAGNASGTSAFSPIRTFTTIVALPAIPTLDSPSDGAFNVRLTPTFTWNSAAGAAGYHLQVATVLTFAALILDDSMVTATSRSVDSLALNTTYFWRVGSRNAAGYSAFTTARSFKTILTTGIWKSGASIPTGPILNQNFPNPFNPMTAISFILPAGSVVTLRVYDVLGKEVATLVDGMCSAGIHTVRWGGSGMPSGVYYCRLIVRGAGEGQMRGFTETKTMILAR